MATSFIALVGNDQKLKDSIFYQYTGIDNQNGNIPLPYSISVLSSVIKDSYYKYQILNTPSTNKKEELLYIWNNLISISKLENLEFATMIYCFMDSQNDINSLLNDLHKLMGLLQYQNEILLLTSPQNFVDQEPKIANRNAFQCIQIDPTKPAAILQYIQKIKYLKLQNLRLQTQQGNNSKEIAFDIQQTTVLEWQEIMAKMITQADFIKIIHQEQFFSQILKKTDLNFNSEILLFNLCVNVREIFQLKKKQCIDVLTNKSLRQTTFYYCTNKNCKQVYFENSSQQLEQLYQIEILLDNPTTSQQYCPACRLKISFLSYFEIINKVFQEFQFRIINNLSQTYQEQESKEKLQNILQIMFLSNEEEEKTKIFNIIQQHYSTDKPRQRNQFVQSSIINNKYHFHNPPPFDFLKDSENTITTFKDYFGKNEIHFFFILVKFERTDILIQRIQNIIKKIHRIDRQRMALIVNQCQCEQEQQAEIEKKFSHFGFKTISFLHENDSPQDIGKTIFQNVENISLQRFDFSDTVFEQEDKRINQQLEENLKKFSQQIETQELNNLKKQLAQEEMDIEKGWKDIEDLQNMLKNKKEQQKDRIQLNKSNQEKLKSWEREINKKTSKY